MGASLATATLVAGCALNGDFDRIRPELVTDDMHAWVGRDAVASIGLPSSGFPLTDDETAMRDLAYAMIEPPYNRNQWDSVFREYGFGRAPREPVVYNRAEYWNRLSEYYRRSQESAYAQLVTDARNDAIRIEPFFAIAGRVADMDRKRAQSLVHVNSVTPLGKDNALFRNNENTAIVGWVCRSLQERIYAYRFALERLVVMVPSPSAVEVERSISLLQARTGVFCPTGASGGRLVTKD